MAKRLDSLRIPLEICLIKLTQDKRGSGEALKPKAQKDEKSVEAAEEKAPKEEKIENPPAVNTEINITHTLDNIKNSWQEIIENLKKVRMSVGTYLDEGFPLKLENNILTISFPKNYSFHKESLEKKENKAIIEKAIEDLLKVKIRLNFFLSKEEARKDKTEDSPFVKSALDIFNAKPMNEG
jgi:DNA polymerase-3 subunit gamma/tau